MVRESTYYFVVLRHADPRELNNGEGVGIDRAVERIEEFAFAVGFGKRSMQLASICPINDDPSRTVSLLAHALSVTKVLPNMLPSIAFDVTELASVLTRNCPAGGLLILVGHQPSIEDILGLAEVEARNLPHSDPRLLKLIAGKSGLFSGTSYKVTEITV